MINWEGAINQYCKAWAWAKVEKMKKFPKSLRKYKEDMAQRWETMLNARKHEIE